MFKHLSTPFPITKPLNKVARYVSKLYPDFHVEERLGTEPYLPDVSYRIRFNDYVIGTLYQDRYTKKILLVLNTTLEFDGDVHTWDKVAEAGNDIVVKWLECVPILRVDNTIIFEVTREDIPNV